MEKNDDNNGVRARGGTRSKIVLVIAILILFISTTSLSYVYNQDSGQGMFCSAPLESNIFTDSEGNIHITWNVKNNNTTLSGIYYMKLDSRGDVLIEQKKVINYSKSESIDYFCIMDKEDNIHIIYCNYYNKINNQGEPLILYSSINEYAAIIPGHLTVEDSVGNPYCFQLNETIDSKGVLHSILRVGNYSEPQTIYRRVLPSGDVANSSLVGSFRSGIYNLICDEYDNLHLFSLPIFPNVIFNNQVNHMKLNNYGDILINQTELSSPLLVDEFSVSIYGNSIGLVFRGIPINNSEEDGTRSYFTLIDLDGNIVNEYGRISNKIVMKPSIDIGSTYNILLETSTNDIYFMQLDQKFHINVEDKLVFNGE